MLNLFYLMLAFSLVLLNAFFVAAEFGMVKLRDTRIVEIEEEYPLRGAILAKVHRQLDAYLSACQLGITLASLGLGWVGEPAFYALLNPVFEMIGLYNPNITEFLSFLLSFSLLSFLHIVVGELMPKTLAIRQSEQVSLWTAMPLYFFYWLMYPIIWVLNSCSNLLLKRLKLNEHAKEEQSHSSAEIKLILRSSQLHGELSPQESSILSHTLELSDLRAMDVMCSPHDMMMLNSRLSKEDLLSTLNKGRYSRYPVFDENKKNIIGLVHVKDLHSLIDDSSSAEEINLKPIIRIIPKITYRLPALTLLKQFQAGMPHFALVYGKQHNLIGFVTLDNLLHLVLGVIKDEFHKTQDAWSLHEDHSLTVKGNCPLFALERALQKDLELTEEQEEIATIAGLILFEMGSVPAIGTIVDFPVFSARVEKTHKARITQVRIFPKTVTAEALYAQSD